jgi:ankyrin repeat protein
MRVATIAFLALVLIGFVGCGGQDESAEQSADAKPTVEPPATDLHSAVILDDLQAILQHIEAGSDLNVLEPSRASTPMITAAALGKTEAVRILIKGGADIDYQNSDGSTALHTAAFFCNEDVVDVLLAGGADKTLKNNMGQTAGDIVAMPFEDLEPAYDVFGEQLKPTGLVLDYDRMKAARPKIAEMLK